MAGYVYFMREYSAARVSLWGNMILTIFHFVAKSISNVKSLSATNNLSVKCHFVVEGYL